MAVIIFVKAGRQEAVSTGSEERRGIDIDVSELAQSETGDSLVVRSLVWGVDADGD